MKQGKTEPQVDEGSGVCPCHPASPQPSVGAGDAGPVRDGWGATDLTVPALTRAKLKSFSAKMVQLLKEWTEAFPLTSRTKAMAELKAITHRVTQCDEVRSLRSWQGALSGEGLYMGPLGSHSPEEGCRAAPIASHPHEGSSAGQQHTGLPSASSAHEHPVARVGMVPGPSSCHVGGCLVRGRSPGDELGTSRGVPQPTTAPSPPRPSEAWHCEEGHRPDGRRACCCPWLPGASFRSCGSSAHRPWTKGPSSRPSLRCSEGHPGRVLRPLVLAQQLTHIELVSVVDTLLVQGWGAFRCSSSHQPHRVRRGLPCWSDWGVGGSPHGSFDHCLWQACARLSSWFPRSWQPHVHGRGSRAELLPLALVP